MITLCDQFGYDGFWSVAIDITFLVQEILNEFAVRNDKRGICESFEAKDTTVFFGPLC